MGLLLAMGLAAALTAAEPGPHGPDIPVGKTFFALCPAVAMNANGEFEVVWNHYYSESHPIPQGIFARHFDRQGRPTQAREIRLDSPANVEANTARVVALPDRGYFVAWSEYRGPRGATAGRFLDSDGRPRSPVLQLVRNADLVGLAVLKDSLLVAWADSGSQRSIRAQRYDLEGHALGEVLFLTANPGPGGPGMMSLAPLADGFVAIWQRAVGASWIIVAQRFSLTGEPMGAMLRVSERRAGNELGARVLASDGNDRFAVAWTTTEARANPQTGQQVFDDETRARFFDREGASGPEAHPNQLRRGNQQAAGLAMDGRGVALVTWSSDRNAATTSVDVAGRFLDSSGPASKAFPLAQNPAGIDFCPAAATNGDGMWVVAWLKHATGIVARRLVFETEAAPEN